MGAENGLGRLRWIPWPPAGRTGLGGRLSESGHPQKRPGPPGRRPGHAAWLRDFAEFSSCWTFISANTASSRRSGWSPSCWDVLRLGAYQILFMDRVPDSAAGERICGAGQELRPRPRRGHGQRPFCGRSFPTKGVFRRSRRKNDETYFATKYSHPAWLVRRCLALLGREETEAFLACNNEAVETTIQYNPLRGSEEALLESLQESGVSVSPPTRGFRGAPPYRKRATSPACRPFSEGRFLVQDAARKAGGASGAGCRRHEGPGSLCRPGRQVFRPGHGHGQ